MRTGEIFNIKHVVLMFAHVIKTYLESSTLCSTSVVLVIERFWTID